MASVLEEREKQLAHALVDRLGAGQLPAALRFLEFILLDPVSRAIALAPFDDEPVSDSEREAVDEANAWLEHNAPIPFDDVLADFGLTRAGLDAMNLEKNEGKEP